jgi:hypothetical protein
LLEVITNLEEIREIITRPNLFHSVTDCLSVDDYKPDPRAIYFKEGNGLVWYVPHGYTCEMFSAVTETPGEPVKRVHNHWRVLARLGYECVYAVVQKHNLRSAMMCRACGMEKFNNEEINMYKKVIYGF